MFVIVFAYKLTFYFIILPLRDFISIADNLARKIVKFKYRTIIILQHFFIYIYKVLTCNKNIII